MPTWSTHLHNPVEHLAPTGSTLSTQHLNSLRLPAFPPATPATSQFTTVFVVPVTVAVNGTVCPTTTDVAEGNTLTVMPVGFPLLLVLEDGLLLQPALHKIARVRNSFPVRPIIISRMFIPRKASMQACSHRECVVSE